VLGCLWIAQGIFIFFLVSQTLLRVVAAPWGGLVFLWRDYKNIGSLKARGILIIGFI
jgi:hypothetical protein